MSGRLLLTKRSKFIFALLLVIPDRTSSLDPRIWRHRTDPNPPPSVRSIADGEPLLPRPSAHFRLGLCPVIRLHPIVDGAFFFSARATEGRLPRNFRMAAFPTSRLYELGVEPIVGLKRLRPISSPRAALDRSTAPAADLKASPIPSGEAFPLSGGWQLSEHRPRTTGSGSPPHRARHQTPHSSAACDPRGRTPRRGPARHRSPRAAPAPPPRRP